MEQPENKEQSIGQIENIPEIFKNNFNISWADNNDVESIIRDENSKLYHIEIKVQNDENGVKPGDYLEKINEEYLQRCKDERIKRKIWKKKLSDSQMAKLDEEWEKWWEYFEKKKCWEEDWETDLVNKYQELFNKRKSSEIKKMRWTRFRDIEKYKEYPSIYNALSRIRDRSENIENIDLLLMEKSPEYEREEKLNEMRWALAEILSNDWNIEEIKQSWNETMKSVKKWILWILSQIQKKWNEVIEELWSNKDNLDENIQLIEDVIKLIPGHISIDLGKKTSDRIKFTYRREWSSWYKYDQTVDMLKNAWKKIINL